MRQYDRVGVQIDADGLYKRIILGRNIHKCIYLPILQQVALWRRRRLSEIATTLVYDFMKKILLTLCLWAVVFCSPLFAQSKLNLDSMLTMINQYPKDDTVKVKKLLELAFEMHKSDTEKALEYTDKAIEICERVQSDFWSGKAYRVKGSILSVTGNNEEATLNCQKALYFFEKGNKYPSDAAKCIFNLGSYAKERNDITAALKHYESAMAVFMSTNDKAMQLRTMGQIASISHTLGDYEKAMETYQKILKEQEKINDVTALGILYDNISILYNDMGNYALGLEYRFKALSLAEQTGNLGAIAHNYDNLSSIYFELGDKKEARKYQLKALDLYRKINNTKGIATEMVNVAITSDDNLEAIAAFKEAIMYCKAVNNTIAQARAHQNLATCYSLENDYTSAYFHAQQGLEIEKEVQDIDNSILLNLSLANVLLFSSDKELAGWGVAPGKRYEKAKEYVDISLALGRNLTPNLEMRSWKMLSSIYEKQENYVQAYDAYKHYVALKDSTTGDDLRRQLTRKEIQYEFDKKESDFKYQQQLTSDQLEKQRLLSIQQQQRLTLNQQALELSNKEKDLAHLAYLKEQAEKQEKAQQLSLSEEREKGKTQDLNLKHLELLTQQKQNIFLLIFAFLLLVGLGSLLYFYATLKKQKNIIAQQNELNENTIAILSHDIKAPLMGVNLLLKKLNKEDPFVAQASQSLETQINSVNSILNNLLRMKKLAIDPKGNKWSANVNTALQNVLHDLSLAIHAKGITIQNELKQGISLPIAPEKLQVILHNLLSNAIKYSFQHQTIRIFQEDNAIGIQDYGLGISDNKRSTLMSEVTASQEGTLQERGTGLGLFLVGALLQGEALKVSFHSPDTGGTVVKVHTML